MSAALIRHPVIAVAGLAFEARAAQGPGVKVVYGQDRANLIRQLDNLAKLGARGIISFGTAGGLSPNFKPGDVIVAASVVTTTGRHTACPNWSRSLLMALPFARLMDIIGVDAPILSVTDKAALWEATGAAAVDMESHLVAQIAAGYNLPFVALRAVIDPAHRAVPSVAMVGLRPDGKTDAAAVLGALRKEPGQLRALLRLARDARKAQRALLRSRKALGPFFGLLDPSELALNM